jgi:hypothetical protein
MEARRVWFEVKMRRNELRGGRRRRGGINRCVWSLRV